MVHQVRPACGACRGGRRSAYYYNHANEEIRLRVQAKLAEHYRDLRVDVRSAHLVEGEGIEIRGLTISDPHLAGVESELAYFDEIDLACNTELKEFLQGEPQINHIHIRRPRLRALRTADGWSIDRLFPCPKFAKRRVETTIENGVVEVIDTSKVRPTTFTLRELHVQLEPTLEEASDDEEPIKYRGTIAGDYFQRAEFSGRIDPQSGNCSAEGTLVGLDLSPEFREALPVELADRLAPYRASARLALSTFTSSTREPPKNHWNSKSMAGFCKGALMTPDFHRRSPILPPAFTWTMTAFMSIN